LVNLQHIVIHIEVRNSYNNVFYLFNTSKLMLSMILTLKYCQRLFIKRVYVCFTINGEPLRSLSFRSPGDQNLVCVIRPLGQNRKKNVPSIIHGNTILFSTDFPCKYCILGLDNFICPDLKNKNNYFEKCNYISLLSE